MSVVHGVLNCWKHCHCLSMLFSLVVLLELRITEVYMFCADFDATHDVDSAASSTFDFSVVLIVFCSPVRLACCGPWTLVI